MAKTVTDPDQRAVLHAFDLKRAPPSPALLLAAGRWPLPQTGRANNTPHARDFIRRSFLSNDPIGEWYASGKALVPPPKWPGDIDLPAHITPEVWARYFPSTTNTFELRLRAPRSGLVVEDPDVWALNYIAMGLPADYKVVARAKAELDYILSEYAGVYVWIYDPPVPFPAEIHRHPATESYLRALSDPMDVSCHHWRKGFGLTGVDTYPPAAGEGTPWTPRSRKLYSMVASDYEPR